MYRTPGDAPPAPDPRIVYPGWGWGPIVVGRSLPDEVLALVGRDAKVARFDTTGEIFEIDYDYSDDVTYDPDRAAQAARPATFEIEFGLVKAIKVGVYQTELFTREGIRIGTRRDEVFARLGAPSEVLRGKELDTLRFHHIGVEVDVDRGDDEVSSMTVFRARW